MELKLKRVLKLRKELEAILARPNLETSISISLFDTELPLSKIVSSREEFANRLSEFKQLSRILANLRIALAKKNVEEGIERLLSDIADIDRCITTFRKISGSELTPAAGILQAEIAMSRKDLDSPKDAYSRNPAREVAYSIVSEDIKIAALEAIAEFKRQREVLEDERALINSTITVSVADADVELLRKLIIL